MAEVHVIRYGGGFKGEDVVEPLLGADLAALLERGRVELDANAEDLQEVRITALFRDSITLGELIYSADDIGSPLLGKVVGIEHSFDDGKVVTTLTILRKAILYE